MEKTNTQRGHGGIARAIILTAAVLSWTSAVWGQAGAAPKAAAESSSVNAVKVVSGGERTDRLVIEFSGPEPELAVQTIEGKLEVTLKGAALAGSVPRNPGVATSLGAVQSVQVAIEGQTVKVYVQAKVKTWSYTATQSRRNITIEMVAAAVQPQETSVAVVPVPIPVQVPVPVPVAPVVAAPTATAADAAIAEAAPPPAEGAPTARRQKLKACVECHEGFYAITKTKHYVRSDARTPGSKGAAQTAAECESCHGDLTAHQKTPRAKGLVPITFGKKSAAEPQNDACLACHQTGTRIHWQGSAHERSKQSCASCHRMHAPKDPVLVSETQASVCFDCHKDRRAEMHRLSTHPTKTGSITCSSCHASHGSSTRASLQKASVNQTCYTCHADKRGPFLWEHRSAQDDCTNCHNPHGTNSPPMLKTRLPYLCQQCHLSESHPSTAYSGNQLVPGASGAARMVGRSCTNCHVKVHGSNHPSGARLQR